MRKGLPTGAGHERHLALAATVLQLVLVLRVHLHFVQVPGCRLVRLVLTYGTRRDLELPAAEPRRLLYFFPRSVTVVQLPRCNYFRVERTLDSQCISLSKA
jgi:hypothetical protein